jgi:hypothetical protein
MGIFQSTLGKKAVFTILAMHALAACELFDPAVDDVQPMPSEPVAPVLPPKPVERDLSLGPRPDTKPVEPVFERAIPPAGQTETSGTVYRAQQNFPESGDLQGITGAHTEILQANGMRGVMWSKALESQAKLYLLQSSNLCAYTPWHVLSSPNEALLVVPTGKNGQGADRYVRLSVLDYVGRIKSAKAGPFGRSGRGASSIGCAIDRCENKQQVWLCRYE